MMNIDLKALAQAIAAEVKPHAWDWDVNQEELELLILKLLESAS